MLQTLPTVHSLRKGEDKLGTFRIITLPDKPICGVCRRRVAVVQYRSAPKVSDYAAAAKGLLIRNKKTSKYIRTIGINCGCYAKVHRQIAHIESGRS